MLNSIFDFYKINTGLDIEIIRIVYLIALVVSLIVYHKRENIPGGIITSGSIVILAGYPLKLFVIILSTIGVYFLYLFTDKYLLSKKILTLREKMLIRVFFSAIITGSLYFIFKINVEDLAFGLIGTVTPALLANHLSKEHKREVFKSLIFAFFIILAVFTLLKFAIPLLSNQEYQNFSESIYANTYPFDFVSVIIIYCLFAFTAITNLLISRKFKTKSAGMLISAYIAIFVFQPLHLLFIFTVIVLSVLIVKWIDRKSLIYGYRTFVISNITAGIIYSILEIIIILASGYSIYPFFGLNLAGIILAGVYTSEFVQKGTQKSIANSLMLSAFGVIVLVIILLISNIFGASPSLFSNIFHLPF